MDTKPDRQDAAILLQALQIYLSAPVVAARGFWRTLPAGLSKAELEAQHPPGSEGHNHIFTLLLFWETIGGLLKQGLLSEELAFDTVFDAPPWPKIEQFVRDLRVEQNDPREGENTEYAYHRAMAFAAARRDPDRQLAVAGLGAGTSSEHEPRPTSQATASRRTRTLPRG